VELELMGIELVAKVIALELIGIELVVVEVLKN
jgi:hypothetical protein